LPQLGLPIDFKEEVFLATKCSKFLWLKLDSATKSWYILWQGVPMSDSVVDAVKSRIFAHGRGWCFTPKHFLDLNSPTGVRSALSRLEDEKIIRRLAQGLYEYPRTHETLGILPPQIDEIAKAISEKNGVRIQPSGAYAANLVGLSEQVPGKVIFLTNGASKKLKIGKLELIFRSAREKSLHATGKVSLVIQALRNLGKASIDQKTIIRIQSFLSETSKQEIEKNLKYAPQWIREVVLSAVGGKK
jgi:hypothetical protein